MPIYYCRTTLLLVLALLVGNNTSYAAITNVVDFSAIDLHRTDPSNLGSIGFQFHVNSTVSILSLGVFDLNQDGLGQPQQVGLWMNGGGVLLASTFVDSSDPLQGFWRFHNLSTPVTLFAGNDYVLGSQGGEGYTHFPLGFATPPEITFVEAREIFLGSTNNSPLVYPSLHLLPAPGIGFFAANARFGDPATVPEPTSFIVWSVLSILGLVTRCNRGLSKLSSSPL